MKRTDIGIARMANLMRCVMVAALVFMPALTCRAEEPIRVAFLAPNPPSNIFWGTLYKVMQAAADDLKIDLQITYSKGNTYSFKKDGEKILAADPKPDYFVTGYWNGVTFDHLQQAEARGIKTFVINTDISKEELRQSGTPRTLFTDWIGHMSPDDRKAGYELAQTLIQAARSQGVDPIRIASVGGSADSAVSAQREKGFADAVTGVPGLSEPLDTDGMWDRTVTGKAVDKLLSAAPDINVVWTASDAMALGAVDALKAAGKTPGKNAFVGGIDWSRDGIDAVARGDVEVTYGGHFMEGAWALILIYDYAHGHDFADDLGTTMHSKMYPITAKNARAYQQVFKNETWNNVDFTKLSKALNPALKHYNFTPEVLLTR